MNMSSNITNIDVRHAGAILLLKNCWKSIKRNFTIHSVGILHYSVLNLIVSKNSTPKITGLITFARNIIIQKHLIFISLPKVTNLNNLSAKYHFFILLNFDITLSSNSESQAGHLLPGGLTDRTQRHTEQMYPMATTLPVR